MAAIGCVSALDIHKTHAGGVDSQSVKAYMHLPDVGGYNAGKHVVDE